MADHDALAFLDEQPAAVTDQPVVVEPVVDAPATPDAPVVEPTVDAPAAPAVEDSADAGGSKQVPLPTFLDMRDKLKAAEARLKELEGTGTTYEVPNPETEPERYRQYEHNMVSLAILNERMNTSERFAVKEHGKELVGKAQEWAQERFKTDPAYEEQVMGQQDPYEVVIRDYNKSLLLKELEDPTEIEAFREWKKQKATGGKPVEGQPPASTGTAKPTAKSAASAAAGKPAAQPQRAAPNAEPIPSSIADAPSSGGTHVIPVGGGQAFDSFFQGK